MLIYLDTNIFIEAVEGRGHLAELILSLFAVRRVDGRALFVTSELSLAELRVKPLELGRADLVEVYRDWVVSCEYLDVRPVSRDVLQQAALVRASSKSLKLPDAIHVATAQQAGCGRFLTRDRRLVALPGLMVVLAEEENLRRLLGALKP